MKIAIDITPLQNLHSARGIGSVVRNLLSKLEYCNLNTDEFIFLAYEHDDSNIEGIVRDLVDNKVNYTINFVFPSTGFEPKKPNRFISIFKRFSPKSAHKLTGFTHRLTTFAKKALGLIKLRAGLRSREIKSINDLSPDIYFQLDPTILLPNLPTNTKTVVMFHDLIPYIMVNDYFWDYRVSRINGLSRIRSVKNSLQRYTYLNIARNNSRHADSIITNSNQTKLDLIKFIGCPADKIKVSLLGVNKSDTAATNNLTDHITRFVHTSWGSHPIKTPLPNKPFIHYVGGADPRRKLNDIVASFNNIKSRGHDIALILAGDTMQGWDNVPNDSFVDYMSLHSTFEDDIYFVGYVDKERLFWLYKNSLAFVYPTVYEGFGLPILEAMQYGTPVITYKNSSIPEVAGDAAMYAKDFLEITDHVINLLENPKIREKYSKLGKKQASKFSWQKTTNNFIQALKSL